MRATIDAVSIILTALVNANLLCQVQGFAAPSLTSRATRSYGSLGTSCNKLSARLSSNDNDDKSGEALPPPFDPEELAISVFAHPWFSAVEGAETLYEKERQKVFEQKTISEIRLEFLEIGSYIEHNLLSGKISYERVEEYFDSVDISTRQKLAERDFTKKFGGEFKTIDVSIGSKLDGLLPGAPKNATQLDLNFLKDLRLPKDQERFLSPNKIYIRDSMRLIFGLFDEDVKAKKRPASRNTAFIGSPGVGKSVLSFLAALYQAQTTRVVYYRHTNSESENDSVFVMTPGKVTGTVTVWFNRNMELGDIGGLTAYKISLERYVIPRTQYYAYVDGPRHDDKENTLGGHYDYLCTSGGFRFYKDEEDGKRLWILDGWNFDESRKALKIYGFSRKAAKEAYATCGGSIRRMLKVCNEGPTRIEKRLQTLVQNLNLETLKLVITSPVRKGDAPDTLRTMFRSPSSVDNWVMNTEQVVDSLFVLRSIRSELNIGVLISGYNAVKGLGLNLAQAEYFEGIIHKWVMDNMPKRMVQNVCRSTGNTQEGLAQLSNLKNVYWIPSVSNYPALDSALMVKNTLFCFQMTKSKRKNIKALVTNFRKKVLPHFRPKFPRLSVAVVYVVVPKGTSINCPPDDDCDGVCVKYKTHEVVMTVDGLDAAMQALFEQIQQEGS